MNVPPRLRPVFLGVVILTVSCDSPTRLEVHTVEGWVLLRDERALHLPAFDQVKVTLLGEGDAALAETMTDSIGEFSLEIPAEGVFSLAFQREGFGSQRRFDVDHEAGRIEVTLFARSTARVTTVEAEARPCGAIPCLRTAVAVDRFFGPATSRRVFRFFYSRDSDPGPANHDVTHAVVVSNDNPGLRIEGTTAHFALDESWSPISSFPSGSTIHLRVYGATENLTNSYVDPVTGIEVFTDLSPEWAQTSFIMP